MSPLTSSRHRGLLIRTGGKLLNSSFGLFNISSILSGSSSSFSSASASASASSSAFFLAGDDNSADKTLSSIFSPVLSNVSSSSMSCSFSSSPSFSVNQKTSLTYSWNGLVIRGHDMSLRCTKSAFESKATVA